MFQVRFVLTFLSISSIAYGISVIDNGTRFNEPHEINKTDEDCSILTPELISEIKSYQSIVDRLTSAAVNGEFSGDTWNA